ncbi:Pls/PosA family non-ribosomal peptide synthetase [Zhihengliuella salsuginis]|uniref:Amino acid adenylation protein n=1 Tax=Zhihengliuella salsuginis TaxID=578222 RepID=A0ABQ3GJ68_9MICC|nr:Pls/PosA family non-ribosomal peptide synthetase [Zhihengliuella salsuginis]GHD07132.1 amino acid adenylation protein [Zhihengliuella salsuginis]
MSSVTPVHPCQFPRGGAAPEPRTLVDIFQQTAEAFPDALALDDGDTALTYSELSEEVRRKSLEMHRAGLGAGDRVGIRIPSGTRELYIGILAALTIGAAYVPVDADDPDERARLVFTEAQVAGILRAGGDVVAGKDRPAPFPDPRVAATGDHAWIIFTSGSTGTPKGVAVSQRSAAAFVDAEARMFLQNEPLGPGDRVLAGLSVAFDASCEEMWLAWRHGACLVPAPRALVRSGADLGPWLTSRGITAVSTVPTLAAIWPAEALENVRLLIFGGEACPPELAARLSTPERELWNTYGPTEATVVACGAQMDGTDPVRIGLPLDGWDLAVVDSAGIPVAEGATGELIIGGVGLARYLDAAKDAEKYAPMPTLGWERAYRSGDLVVNDPAGLIFVGRADEQVKLGGRRIELGEIDASLQSLPGVAGAAAAVKTTAAGNQLLIGYLVAAPDHDLAAARERLASELPAALIPRLAVVDTLPTKTSGKVDRAALPWPLEQLNVNDDDGLPDLSDDARFIVDAWAAVLGAEPAGLDTDFFASGGGSLPAAQLVSRLRTRYPSVTVGDLYEHPRLGALLEDLGEGTADDDAPQRTVAGTRRGAQVLQTVLGVPLFVLVGLRWLTYLLIGNNIADALGILTSPVTASWWSIGVLWLVFVSPIGRMGLSVASARLLLRGVSPGVYPRSGRVHLRLWLAQHIADLIDPVSLMSAPWVPLYARALGARVGRGATLHSVPPVTGMLTVGKGASVEPEVDLSGYWIDGDDVHVGSIRIGAGATIGARSTLLPGARVGSGTDVQAGSAVVGATRQDSSYAGSPAKRTGRAKPGWPDAKPAGGVWATIGFGLASAGLALIPWVSILGAALVGAWLLRGGDSLSGSWSALPAVVPLVALVWFVANAVLIALAVRALGLGLAAGWHPVRSRIGWQVWATERLLDTARDLLFPLYASLFTPVWLRLLGAKVGRNVEASTVLLVPKMTTIASGAFLADDTMVASYELGGGWMHVGPAKIGKRAFLGNSGIAAAGRRVPKRGLVAVLSATPPKAKAGSSWLGSPPVRLRRVEEELDESRTFQPPIRLKAARAAWEICRFVPVMVTVGIAAGVLVALDLLAGVWGPAAAVVVSGAVMLAAGAVAAGVSLLAKWVVVGRIRAGRHELWTSFIWRNEVVDTFVEMVCAPWFARAASGTPALVWFLRGLGARIGHGVWCESYWLPEADLVHLGDSSTVNRGCVVQTHLFHDRVMAIDSVELGRGATLGPNGVILPAASIGDGATVGPVSLVMRGEAIMGSTSWMGNPVKPWKRPEPLVMQTAADVEDAPLEPAAT